ncbi:hypothetical protein ACT691_11225 [Vibrio metschnikovii]
MIYSLSIAVYCTSWTFYGTVGQASANPWSFLPIYLAPMLVFIFGWRVLARLILIAKREHITSIADFIGARYGKSQGLAVTVTLIAVAGILSLYRFAVTWHHHGTECGCSGFVRSIWLSRITIFLGLWFWHWRYLPCCLVRAILIIPSIIVA